MKRALICASLLSVALATPSSAQQNEGRPFVVQETGKSYKKIADAVDSIGGGQGTILIAPGQYRQCAIQRAGRIIYRAQVPGSVIFDKETCDGKAALVLQGNAARVEGIIFQNMKVPDENGAGIRLEKGRLDVFNSTFRNSQQGILTAHNSSMLVNIDRSTFSGLGLCASDCSHSIYIGEVGQLTVTRSRFERGTGGHYVKSRSGRNDITDNSFDDTQGRETNYMIDLPQGSVGAIVRNEFVQGQNKENWSAFIAVGAEKISNPSAGLIISNNRAAIAPGVSRSTFFVADWTHQPLRIDNNAIGEGLKLFETR
jgi:hypothetical protein